MELLLLMAGRKIVEIEAKNVEAGEKEGDKKETQNGKNVLFKLEEFPKQLKVVRK